MSKIDWWIKIVFKQAQEILDTLIQIALRWEKGNDKRNLVSNEVY